MLTARRNRNCSRTVAPVEARPRDQAPPPAAPALRPDVAQALERVRGALVGSTKVFVVYTTKPTKRAIPAMAVRVGSLADAQAVAQAAQTASAAPRLDVV